MLFERWQHAIHKVWWIRLTMAISLLGSILILKPSAQLLWPGRVGRIGVLLAADVLLFPSFMLASGLTEGLGASLSLPPGNAFDLSSVMLWNLLGVDCVGRFV